MFPVLPILAIMKLLKALRLTVPMGLAALMLTVAGSMSPASATTYWSYMNDHEGNCLTSSTVSDSVWSDTCNDSLNTRNWYWGSYSVDIDGHTWRQLVSKANGGCLSTDNKTLANAVWAGDCGSNAALLWSADGNRIRNYLYGTYLRTSDNGNAVYVSPLSVINSNGIDASAFVWWGAHS